MLRRHAGVRPAATEPAHFGISGSDVWARPPCRRIDPEQGGSREWSAPPAAVKGYSRRPGGLAGAVGDGRLRRPSSWRAPRTSSLEPARPRRQRGRRDPRRARMGRQGGRAGDEVDRRRPRGSGTRRSGRSSPRTSRRRRRRATSSCSRRRRPWTKTFTPGFVQDAADDAWKAAKLERVTLHQLRHGYRSFLDAAGISEARADRYLGHASTSVGRLYTHAIDGQLDEDAKRLEDTSSVRRPEGRRDRYGTPIGTRKRSTA